MNQMQQLLIGFLLKKKIKRIKYIRIEFVVDEIKSPSNRNLWI